MLDEIGSKDKVPAYIEKVKDGHGKLMGFGHRIYKNYDPRARIIKWTADQVFEVTGRNPKLDIALELERIALEDDYFIKRKLYPNVDFYSGIIYQAMGFKPEMFTVLFAIPRTAGWLAQWQEMLDGSGAEDRASAADLHRTRCARVRADGKPRSGGGHQTLKSASLVSLPTRRRHSPTERKVGKVTRVRRPVVRLDDGLQGLPIYWICVLRSRILRGQVTDFS